MWERAGSKAGEREKGQKVVMSTREHLLKEQQNGREWEFWK